ncbi:hypothetical protein [Flindersiella endophytica]
MLPDAGECPAGLVKLHHFVYLFGCQGTSTYVDPMTAEDLADRPPVDPEPLGEMVDGPACFRRSDSSLLTCAFVLKYRPPGGLEPRRTGLAGFPALPGEIGGLAGNLVRWRARRWTRLIALAKRQERTIRGLHCWRVILPGKAYVDDLRQRAEAGVEAAAAALADLPRRVPKLAEIWELTHRNR